MNVEIAKNFTTLISLFFLFLFEAKFDTIKLREVIIKQIFDMHLIIRKQTFGGVDYFITMLLRRICVEYFFESLI